MGHCPNCKTKITCGCQRAKAADGTRVCTNCVKSYNEQIKSKSPAPTPTSPTNVKAEYKGPGKQL